MLNLKERLSLAWRILRARDNNLISYAEDELLRAFPPDGHEEGALAGWNDAMRRQLREMAAVFAIQGNSGMSASVALSVMKEVLAFRPLTPLTGEDDEWCEVAKGMWQSQRCPTVFKETGGQAYDINGYVFEDPEGVCCTAKDSRKEITFPYMPSDPEVVKVDADGQPIEPEYTHADLAPLALLADAVKGAAIEVRSEDANPSYPFGVVRVVATFDAAFDGSQQATNAKPLFDLLCAAKLASEGGRA